MLSPAQDTVRATRDGRLRTVATSRRVRLGLVLLLLSGLLWYARWSIDPKPVIGDTFWYTRYALQLAGRSPGDATTQAAEYVVTLYPAPDAAGQSGGVGPWVSLASTIDPRYPAIFTERPLYPLTAAILMPFTGPNAMVLSAAAAGLFLGALLGLFVFSLTGSILSALSATVLVFVLPAGSVIALPYADGWMLVWWVLALAAGTRYLVTAGLCWLAVFGAAAALLAVTKAADVLPLAAGLVGTAAFALASRSAHPRRALALCAVAVGVALGENVAILALGLPGLTATLQDLFTGHFAKPDVADPVGRLVSFDTASLPQWIRRILRAGLQPFTSLARNELLLVIGSVGLVQARAIWVLPWLLGAAATVMVVLLHPVATEIPRLLAPLWPSVALGLALWVAKLERTFLVRRSARPAGSPLQASQLH